MPDSDEGVIEPPSGQPLTVEADGRPTRIRLNVAWKPIELRRVDVLSGLPIEDASPPHLLWDAASNAPTRQEPALLLQGTKLTLRVGLSGGKPTPEPARLVAIVKSKRLSHELKKDVDP